MWQTNICDGNMLHENCIILNIILLLPNEIDMESEDEDLVIPRERTRGRRQVKYNKGYSI